MGSCLEVEKTHRRFPLAGAALMIGREEGCDIVIDDPSVSRRHCTISEDGAFIADNGSRNGTFIDGVKLAAGQKVKLRVGSSVLVGSVVCHVRDDAAPQKTSAQPAGKTWDTQSFGIEDLIGRRVDTHELDHTLGQVLFKAQQALYPGQPIETLLDSLLRIVLEFIPANRASIQLVSDDLADVEPTLTLDKDGETLGHVKDFLMSQGVRDKVLSERQCVLIRDVAADIDFKNRKSLVQAGITSAVAAPIFDGSDMLGILYADVRDGLHELQEAEATIISLLASFGGTMLSAANMVTALMRSEAELREENDLLRQQLAAVGVEPDERTLVSPSKQ